MTPELSTLLDLDKEVLRLGSDYARYVREQTLGASTPAGGISVDPEVVTRFVDWVHRFEGVVQLLDRDYSRDPSTSESRRADGDAEARTQFDQGQARALLSDSWEAFVASLPSPPSESWDADDAFKAWETLMLVRAGVSYRTATRLVRILPKRSATRRVTINLSFASASDPFTEWCTAIRNRLAAPELPFAPQVRRLFSSAKAQVAAAIVVEADGHVGSYLPHPVCQLSAIAGTISSALDAAKVK